MKMMREAKGEYMNNIKKDDKPINKPVKKVQFFEAKQHIEIIRQVRGETAFIERPVDNRNKSKRK